jgi:hypothetical protein
MSADEMAEILFREFWCFATFTETNDKNFTDEMATKNALKHCYLILNSDPQRDHTEYDYNQNKIGVDEDFWMDVTARLEKRMETFNIKNKHNGNISTGS